MHTEPPAGPERQFFAPSSRIGNALILLRNARAAADELRLDPWEIALGLPMLVAVGASVGDIRWMVAEGLAECGQRQMSPESVQRQMSPESVQRSSCNWADRLLTGDTCFILTAAGERRLQSENEQLIDLEPTAPLVPRWDRDSRQLWYAGLLVKAYRRRAGSQETILAAFEEDGWPARIDDPLPLVPGLDRAERLHEAVRRLNRSQRSRLLVFQRDGTGEGVRWRGLVAQRGATDLASARQSARVEIDRTECRL